MSCCLSMYSVQQTLDSGLSLEKKGECCRSFQAMQCPWNLAKSGWVPSTAASSSTQRPSDHKKERCPKLRPAVQHVDRWGENGKKANCFTLLRRTTRLKYVNSEIKSNVGSTTWKGIPRRAHVILSNRHEWHTCSEQLFELLTWNVSFMQKNQQNRHDETYDYILYL